MIILEFEAPVRTRLHRYFWAITTFGHSEDQDSLWWDETERQWVTSDKRVFANGISSHCRCRTLRAFKSHLRKHREVLKDYRVFLVSRYEGHLVEAFFE